jgi:hypothetical protein
MKEDAAFDGYANTASGGGRSAPGLEVWSGPLVNSTFAVVVVNLDGTNAQNTTLMPPLRCEIYGLRRIWAHLQVR